MAQIVILACKSAAKFFSVLQGAVKQKRLKNTALVILVLTKIDKVVLVVYFFNQNKIICSL